MLVTAVSLVFLAISGGLLAHGVRSTRAQGLTPMRSAVAWSVAFMLVLAFVAAYAGVGLIENDPVCAVVLGIVVAGCVWVSSHRPAIDGRLRSLQLPRIGRVGHTAAPVILLCVAAVLATLALEVPSNHDIGWMYPLCFLLEWFIIVLPLIALYFLSQRRGAASAVLVLILHIVGIAEYFVILFKSVPIQPGDLSALGTAMAVSGGYEYFLSPYCVYGMAFACAAFLLCELAGAYRPERAADARVRRNRLAVNLAVGMACIAGLVAHTTLIDYYNTLYVQVYTWRPLESYYRVGFLPCFISSTQTIIPRKPKDYSVEAAQELIKQYAADYDEKAADDADRAAAEKQFAEEKPTVIAIMNETFSDLSIYENMHANYQGPQYFKTLGDCLSRGTFYVSAYGGGTANSEFEFLTGNSMAYLGSGVYPYTIYNLIGAENLAAQFKELGYGTTAMHPNHATNWNRENVYSQFGFDQFLSIDDFQDSEKLRGMVTDKATYQKILELLEENDDPQFIFDVTMQNHSGYNTGAIPADKKEEYYIDGVANAEVNEYLSLIQQSDEALQYLIERLRHLDRKVVLVFFGDHQPFFPDRYNNMWFAGEDSATHAERLWQTGYILWANYDVAGNAQESEQNDLSANYLGATLMETIGAPLSDFQKAQLSLREAMPAINATGFEDASGKWYLSNAATSTDTDEKVRRARKDLQTMQYYHLFGDGSDAFTHVLQSAANETDPNLAPGTTKIKK